MEPNSSAAIVMSPWNIIAIVVFAVAILSHFFVRRAKQKQKLHPFESLVKILLEQIDGDLGAFDDETQRIRVRYALLKSLRRISSPWEIATDHLWIQGVCVASAKTLIYAGVFQKWAEDGGQPSTCARLAQLAGIDVVLLRRMVRCLAAHQLLIETAPDTYARTPWAVALGEDPAFAGMYGLHYSKLNSPMLTNLPYFLKDNGFTNPTDGDNGNFQHLNGKGTSLFQYMGEEQPGLLASFHQAMECRRKFNITPWPDLYPASAIIADAKPGRALIVDIGGSKGNDLKLFLDRHPRVNTESLVLQDLPTVLEGVDVTASPAIMVQPHDFFTPQPVKGARVYFMHLVLHDWTDDVAGKILGHIADAMEKGYSKLLIYEVVVSNQNPHPRATVTDITMMALLASAERSEADWNQLLADSGLRINKIWRSALTAESVIEAELR